MDIKFIFEDCSISADVDIEQSDDIFYLAFFPSAKFDNPYLIKWVAQNYELAENKSYSSATILFDNKNIKLNLFILILET